MSNIAILRYNNYANRIVKGYQTMEAYRQELGRSGHEIVYTFYNINFSSNDGVDSELVLNMPVDNVNYLIVYEGTEQEQDEQIISRWFILDAERLRNGQYKLKLKRDVIYDNLEAVVKSTAFINRGYVGVTDPAIYNSESITTNQIKTSETLLKQYNIDTPWIVGYLTDTDSAELVEYQNKGAQPEDLTEQEFLVLSTAETIYDYYNEDRKKTKYSLPSAGSPTVPKVSFFQCNFTDYDYLSTSIVDISQIGRNSWYTTEYEAHQLIEDMDALSRQFQEDLTSTADFYNAVRTAIRNVPSTLEYNELKKYNNKLVSYLGKVYSVKLTKNGTERKHLSPGTSSTVTTKVTDFLNSNSLVVQDDLTNADVEIKIDYTVPAYSVQFEVYTEGNYKCTIPAGTGRTKLSNQPYSMFCMPWENFHANVANLSSQFNTSGEANRCIAQAIAEKFSKTALIDLQLLPYCPLQNQLVRNDLNNYTIYHVNFPESARQVTPIYKTVSGTDTIVSYLYWADSADFTFDIDLSNPLVAPNDPIEFKVANQVDFYRLCSPNYNGQFEFSATKNDGVKWFNVDCTYKPYSPYIHVNPYFRGLYGADFNDARGLICSGDFSLPQSSDAWSNYEINNKNYENIFKTNISLLEESNKYAKVQDIFNAITGAVGGAGSGAITGSMIAPGLGTAVGAVGGGLLSTAGGIANAIINPMLREHQLQAQKDIHQFELQNIRAIPDSLTKVGALNFNNKIFPFLEYYTCTDEEKEAVRNLLKWYNMKIGRIGVIEDFINPEYNYIQANIIKIELNEDFHMAESIKEAVSGGLYFGKDEE